MDGAGDEWQSPVDLSPPLSSGTGVGLAIDRGLRATVTSPLALPFDAADARLVVRADDRWARFVVPEPVEPEAWVGDDFAIELQEVFDVAPILRSGAPLGGLHLAVHSVDRLPPVDQRSGGMLESITESLWVETPEGFELPIGAEGMPAGRYRAAFIGMDDASGLFLNPEELDLGPTTGSEVVLWVEAAPAAERVAVSVHLRFAATLDQVLANCGGQMNVTLSALDGSQLSGGAPRITHFLLGDRTATRVDEWTAAFTPDDGFAAGDCLLGIRPIGFSARLTLDTSAPVVAVGVPPLGLVELRPAQGEADAIVSAAGYDLATGRMSGLRVRTRAPGT
ncbi:hypothetical protein Pla86_09560 [Planctomycetes bacterium Pla86]|uniref:Uncharacterized protein n=1 Tax=Engelhardtia mirabilis TaxID=2528011 RepID=A0A518BFY6_9BACT|nr:hypothetical protein Pla133_09570 [Planctomycetes bacterium Pla133]QDV00217.1 hypothetical protein Pla86_09560 [Planctomycetes bacterium Pla86]